MVDFFDCRAFGDQFPKPSSAARAQEGVGDAEAETATFTEKAQRLLNEEHVQVE